MKVLHWQQLRFENVGTDIRDYFTNTFRGLYAEGTRMVVQGFTVDLNKPLVFQVGHLGEAYQEWVHQPIVSKEGPRFFESDFWEFLTRTVWWAIPTIWLPVVCWCISMSVQMGHTFPEIALMVVFGIFIWTFIEYTLHRFLFHIKTKSYWLVLISFKTPFSMGNTIHYLLHGCHHKHPMDGLRLVFPPAATAVLCVPFWNLVKFFATPSTTPALFGGGLLGYVMYDVTHYYLHHGQPSHDVPKNLKAIAGNEQLGRLAFKTGGITSIITSESKTRVLALHQLFGTRFSELYLLKKVPKKVDKRYFRGTSTSW
ncbi:hypothetical protein Cgig2_005806 [Carnegiea gigantea]|uniref:Fatty acid 2-hydroxylase n=1 Tax=Carnegiea gigantea TaxID=171969 RepID=A0A9Q1KID5_9CARY|nr:hypothetical protein Cgig2_005806 [Carnegiea gigantea]